MQRTLNPAPPFFVFTLVTRPSRSLSLKLRDTRVYEPQIRARLGNPLASAQLLPAGGLIEKQHRTLDLLLLAKKRGSYA